MSDNLFDSALQCLMCQDPADKCRLTVEVCAALEGGRLVARSVSPPRQVSVPGRPARPRLVAPRDLPKRKSGSVEGRAGLLHALAHIEFNAINLAWDAVYRFRDMPAEFYTDWAGVAREEALHFGLLRDCLQRLGYAYGDFDAHNGLWDMACRTAHDPLIRMALVPRVLEARGLDVTPAILARLRASGDQCAVEALEVVQRDEVGHVEIGSRWFRYCCELHGLDPESTFIDLLNAYMPGQVRPPFQYDARRRAGFNDNELRRLEELAAGGERL